MKGSFRDMEVDDPIDGFGTPYPHLTETTRLLTAPSTTRELSSYCRVSLATAI